MEHDDTNQFWNSWRQIYNNKNAQFAPVVDGCSDNVAIAEAFRKSFEANCKPNNMEKVEALDSRFHDAYNEFCSRHHDSCNCSQYQINMEVLIEAICSLKNGKCADGDGIHAEHFQHAPFNFLLRISKLLNAMLNHAFVPKQFRFGHMIPIVKDAQGNLGDTSNYRGITISPILSKIFEHVLKQVFVDHLKTSSYQFGFKKAQLDIPRNILLEANCHLLH